MQQPRRGRRLHPACHDDSSDAAKPSRKLLGRRCSDDAQPVIMHGHVVTTAAAVAPLSGGCDVEWCAARVDVTVCAL
ncbi:hypothetical protein MRX96_056984 [Rhipicephalus microplus]